MNNLSDKILPYLKLTEEQMIAIEGGQVEEIPFAKRGYFKDVDYQNKIAILIKKKLKKSEKRDSGQGASGPRIKPVIFCSRFYLLC